MHGIDSVISEDLFQAPVQPVNPELFASLFKKSGVDLANPDRLYLGMTLINGNERRPESESDHDNVKAHVPKRSMRVTITALPCL